MGCFLQLRLVFVTCAFGVQGHHDYPVTAWSHLFYEMGVLEDCKSVIAANFINESSILFYFPDLFFGWN
jgi:hypothetical protein